MVHAKKKQLANYLFLTFGLYFLFQTINANEHQDFDNLQDFDIINEATNQNYNSQDAKNETIESNQTHQDEPAQEPATQESLNTTPTEDTKTTAVDTTEPSDTTADITSQTSTQDSTLEAPKEIDFPHLIDYAKRHDIHSEKRKIRNIIVSGNKIITNDSIIHRLPLKVGDIFNLNYTSTMIKNLYKSGYFHQVKVYVEPIEENELDLYITVQEKPRLKEVTFTGNKAVSAKEFKEELKTANIPTLVQEELVALISKMKKLYQKKNYHAAEITGAIIPQDDGTVSAEFTINEGKKSYLTRIDFKGNKHVSSKKLKRILISKEDWILGMLDHSGTYNPEMLEGDKYMIEDSYKSNGFVHAKTLGIDVEKTKSGNYHLTYSIFEGDRYTIKSVTAEGNDVLSEEQIRSVIPIYPGQFYSLEKIRVALDNLKMLWGEYGYIFADIDPVIDINDEDKTVSISFHADLKNQIYLNRLTIKGNKKSKDSVIRRNILLDEGELITNRKMEISKNRTNLLNYFDPKNGVNWKTTRVDDTHADLELVLKEIQTGHFQFNLGYGGSPSNRQSPTTGLNFNCNAGDRNLWGTGVATSISAEISKRYRAFNLNLVDPWLGEKPIRGALNAYVKKSEYDSVDIAENPPFERAVGGSASIGYMTSKLNGFLIEGVLQYEKINYDQNIKAANYLAARQRAMAQLILDQNFQAGTQISLVCNLSQDKRDGIVFTTRGHQWSWVNQITLPGQTNASENLQENCPEPQLRHSRFQYYRSELDVTWYTPLINEYDLVLCVHGNAGYIYKFNGKQVPWKSVYHVGGPTTIRGYLYGQVGPTWNDTSLGALKAFNLNVEFIAPLSSNLNTRAVIFYDGGAGWDTPYYNTINKEDSAFGKEIQNNKFFYRHSVGIGMRIKSPTPLQVDFGIKLNPSKKFRRELTQLHLNVEHSF